MQLINHYLPVFQFHERHAIVVTASPKQLLDAVLLPNVMDDPWTKKFIWLRELPDRVLGSLGASSGLHSRPAFGFADFMPLGRDKDCELAFGLLGRFWQSDYGLVRVSDPPVQFAQYEEAHLAKLVLNFSVEVLAEGRCRLKTETRVHCTDARALHRVTPYWWLIRPVSGLIRRRLLRRICDKAISSNL